MSAGNPKLFKVTEFRPNLSDQNDKRNLKRARDDMECLVTKSYNNLAFPCFGGVPVLDPKRGVVGMEIFAMAGPLKNFFSNDIKEKLLEALQESMVEVLAKLRVDEEQETSAGDTAELVEQLAKPLKPIFYMTSTEMDTYFPAFKTSVARKDGIQMKRKWAKIVDGNVTEPTSLPSFDAFVESVLPSSQYFGAKTKFAAGNLLWRQQLVCAYILEKNGYDYNTYAQNVTDDHVAKTWKIADLVELGNNPKETARFNVMKRNKGTKVSRIVQDVAPRHEQRQDTTEEHDQQATFNQEDEVHENPGDGIVAGVALEDEAESLDNSLLGGSHSSGSPVVSRESSVSRQGSFDARILEIERARVQESEKEIVFNQMKAAGNDIMLFSAGENREEGFIFQAYDLEYMDAAKAYRATLSDGRKASNKVLFNSSLNDEVTECLREYKNVIKVLKHRIFNRSMIIIDDFEAYWDAQHQILGEPELLRKDYLEHIFQKEADAHYATSPGLLERKVTKRNPPKLIVKKTKTVGR